MLPFVNLLKVSIRSPRRNEGRLLLRLGRSLGRKVSIRSPRRNEGRHQLLIVFADWMPFQSAPPAETRGDCRRSYSVQRGARFNPLPPPKRGETYGEPE